MVDAESLSCICPTRLNKARRLRPFAAHRINLHNADEAAIQFSRFADVAFVRRHGTCFFNTARVVIPVIHSPSWAGTKAGFLYQGYEESG